MRPKRHYHRPPKSNRWSLRHRPVNQAHPRDDGGTTETTGKIGIHDHGAEVRREGTREMTEEEIATADETIVTERATTIVVEIETVTATAIETEIVDGDKCNTS
eukprot:m.151785 g.151785  ORF g.151785 m.151785 type:complete len:104 (+) comp23364_c0_seq1:2736-3047(+)